METDSFFSLLSFVHYGSAVETWLYRLPESLLLHGSLHHYFHSPFLSPLLLRLLGLAHIKKVLAGI